MNYHPWPDSHIRDKVKVVITIDLSNYATKNELENVTGVYTSNLAAKRDFIVSKPEMDKLDVNKLFNVSTGLNSLKIKVDDLDIDKLNIVPVDFKKLSDVVSEEVVKKMVYNKLNAKVNCSENRIPDATILIYMNQCNT